MIHRLLPIPWRMCRQDSADSVEDLAAVHLDNPDLNPAMVQKVRVAKVEQLLWEPDAC